MAARSDDASAAVDKQVTGVPDDSPVRPPAGSGLAHARAAAAAPDPDDRPRGFAAVVAQAKRLLAWWQGTRAARTNARFGERGGGLLTGGIAYATLFSVIAGLTLGFTVFLAVLGNNDEVRDSVVAAIDGTLPGVIATDGGEGLVDPASLRLSTGVGVAGVVSVVVLVLSAITAVAALRTGVRAMFDHEGQDNAVLGKLRELGGFVWMGVAILLSALLTLGVATAADWLLDALGWSGSSEVVLRVLGVLVAFVVDAATFVLVVRVLANASPPRRDLLQGAVIAGVGLGIVRLLGTSVVSGTVERYPALGAYAVVLVLLLWINLISRIVLLAAAWSADPGAEDGTTS